jgi:hypothetical protein
VGRSRCTRWARAGARWILSWRAHGGRGGTSFRCGRRPPGVLHTGCWSSVAISAHSRDGGSRRVGRGDVNGG